jgi:hypothetical protein
MRDVGTEFSSSVLIDPAIVVHHVSSGYTAPPIGRLGGFVTIGCDLIGSRDPSGYGSLRQQAIDPLPLLE